ncbi:hypothetical protein EDD37DRAFT_350711 [Exophiala viscosa]|uniref:uncharacterized protein n=1 Tax=Exophiala viscosa TaxID=2486360 RepID=UPI00219C0297|nr:hypothetical protein EDD37DRAFT_350711 [Exophiala viscosa]
MFYAFANDSITLNNSIPVHILSHHLSSSSSEFLFSSVHPPAHYVVFSCLRSKPVDDMPTLKDLVCHVEWADTGSPFPEYGTIYGDGLVETFIAIPNHPQAFTVRLTSRRFIFEGLAMIIFIDGNYQCNRNRCNLRPPQKDQPKNRTEIDFTVRQKEKPLGDGTYMGREWRFDDYNIVSQLPEGVSQSHFDELGTIEVLILRCRSANPNEVAMSTTSSGEDSDCLGGDAEDNLEDNKSSKVVESRAEPEGDPFGGLAGLFDGAFDQPPSSHGPNGDAPADGYSRWNQPDPYRPQESFHPTYTYRPAFRGASPPPPRHYQPSPLPFTRPPIEYGPPRQERRVHFDYGDRRDPHYSASQSAYGPRARGYEEPGWQGGDAYRGHPSERGYAQAGNLRATDPYSDYPYHDDRRYEYNVGARDYSDHPGRHQEYERYRPGPIATPPTFASRPAPQNGGTMPKQPPVNAFQPVAAHPHAAPTAGAPVIQQFTGHPAVPVWVPPVAYSVPPPFPGHVPVYPLQTNAPLFHTQAPAGHQIAQNGVTSGLAPPGQGQPNTEPSRQSDASQPNWNHQPENGQHTEPADPPKGATTGTGWGDNNNSGNGWQDNAAAGGTNRNDTSAGNDDWRKNDDNNASWENNNNDKSNNGNDWDKGAAADSGWDQNAHNQANDGDWQNSGSNTGQVDAGWNNNTANNDTNNQAGGGWGTDQNNNAGGNASGGNWGDTQNNNPPTTAPTLAVNGPSTRALYGPYGAYYTSKVFAESRIPADAEEEPRYDIPQAVAQAKGTSKQVQPGKGYIYTKKRCIPEYIDNLDEPYARFVFKYRTKEQIKNETGIEVDVEPTGNEDVNELANLDKEELIQLVLRAKGALGGTIPDPPPKTSTAASSHTFEPVPVAPPEFEFLKYKLPPARNAANPGLGIRVSNPSSGQNPGNGSANQGNNDWSKGAADWTNERSNNQQNTTTANDQAWTTEAAGWQDDNANTKNNGQGWDGQQEGGNKGSQQPSFQPNTTSRKGSEQPKSVRSSTISPKNTSKNNPPGSAQVWPSGSAYQGGDWTKPMTVTSAPAAGIAFHGAGTVGGGQTQITGAGPRPPSVMGAGPRPLSPPKGGYGVPDLSPPLEEGYGDRPDPPSWSEGNTAGPPGPAGGW